MTLLVVYHSTLNQNNKSVNR